MTAIHYAAYYGDLNILKELIDLGGNISKKDDYGNSAL